jgi:CheY-like chemotaxis protein
MPQNNLVLLIDDDADDRELFADAITEIDTDVKILILESGKQLMDFLLAPNQNLPDILFLDINMPVKNGFECLEEIRANETTRDLCVIMFSTSHGKFDVDKSYSLGADGYIQKPFSLTEMRSVLKKTLDTDWKDPCVALDRHNFVLRA